MRKRNPVPTTPEGYSPLTLRLPNHLLDALRNEAKEVARSMNSQVIVILAERYGLPIEPPIVTQET
jgi:hypothetical protein